MKALRGWMNLLPLLFFILLPASTPARAEAPTATYKDGAISLSIPYHLSRAGSGELTAELLDPENKILGRTQRIVQTSQGDGTLQQLITPQNKLPFEELIWERIRYRFVYSGEKAAAFEETHSISQILRRPVVHILGQSSYLTEGPAAIRIIVTDANNRALLEHGDVRVELVAENQSPILLFKGQLNHRGTIEARFQFPARLTGSYRLHYIIDTPIGSTDDTQTVQLEEKSSILLTTEKPIYQPGQTIHVRALALDRASHKATADKPLTFELEDSRGNKVFKKATSTDSFGIASAEFSLADEVNLGTYHLRALIGEANAAANTAEIALNVQRYVLPKFKVTIDFDRKDGKPKRDYRPGDHVTGTIHANYFFGKPVDNAEITLKASNMDVTISEAASATGKAGKDGSYHFDLRLPGYFAGQAMNKGAALVLVEAFAKDSTGHSETRGEPITVSQSPLLITAIPEGGSLIPRLDNQVFILTSYPDGTPASTYVTVHIDGASDQSANTDKSGVAVVRVLARVGHDKFQIEADDHRGSHTSTEAQLDARAGSDQTSDQILLRTERALYRAGDSIHLDIFSTKQRGSAYIDIVKNGQTILTRDVDIENGHANLTMAATSEMAGTLDFNAYLFGRDAQPIGDHRLIFVQPADDLRIEATADAPAYKPGAEANIRFRVSNAHGEGVRAALGLQVVDEAVFALAEKQPGFAKVFFYLEQEVMKPRYEIHSLSMSDVIEPISRTRPQPEAEEQNTAARALFSATEMTHANSVQTEFGASLPTSKYWEYQNRYNAAFLDQVKQIAAQLGKAYLHNPSGFDATREFSTLNSRDAWGSTLRIADAHWTRAKERYYLIRSAGADGEFNTGDDLREYIEVRSGITGQPGSRGSSADIEIEHDRGPFNGRASVTGTVTDASGARIPGAQIVANLAATGETRRATADGSGQFTLTAIPAGTYTLTITALGFEALQEKFTTQPRDAVAISATLNVGSVTEAVTVTTEAVSIVPSPPMARAGMARGVGGAVFKGRMAMDTVTVNAAQMENLPLDGRDVQALMKLPEGAAAPAGEAAPTHIRSYFPEALYINPEILTDGKGEASITIPIADSITTWRMAMLASTVDGTLGTGTSSLKVFQDFFVDLDLPVTLTQGDRVSIPVAIYNYSGQRGEVSLKLQPDDWYSLVDDTHDKSLSVEADHPGGSQFTLEAKRIGKFKLTLSAQLDGSPKREDIVVREIEVIPNGREQTIVYNGHLDTSAGHKVAFPAAAIPDASKIFVRLYPGPLSQVIEGMDSILRMPGGCFEQTSSSTYPNVLALDYMKRTKKLTPEVHAKAEGYIANGYQRLLTFEVPGGGFSWFGRAPANKILTAYGLMEFSDMSKVYEVDPRLIERTQQWLAAQQQADGSWKPDTEFINEGATNRYNSDVLRITAYLAWSLGNTGYHGPAIEKAKQYIENHLGAKRESSDGKTDAYTLAILANFAADYRKDRDLTQQVMQLLLDARTETADQVSWNAEETGVYSTGSSAAIETTGLAAQALLKWGQAAPTVRKALNYITSKKDAIGAWGTTQATIMALRAVLLASAIGTSDVHGHVEITLNGRTVQALDLNSDNNDLLHQFVLKGSDLAGENNVQLQFTGTGGLAYQVAGSYFLPWEAKPAQEPLSIDLAYDRNKLAQNDIATAIATIQSNLDKTAKMVMVDLGIPPGFDLLSEDFQDFQDKSATQNSGHLEKFSLTATQAILYFDSLAPHQTVTLHYRLRAKYPIRAHTFESRVYEYYDPSVTASARPVQLEVSGR